MSQDNRCKTWLQSWQWHNTTCWDSAAMNPGYCEICSADFWSSGHCQESCSIICQAVCCSVWLWKHKLSHVQKKQTVVPTWRLLDAFLETETNHNNGGLPLRVPMKQIELCVNKFPFGMYRQASYENRYKLLFCHVVALSLAGRCHTQYGFDKGHTQKHDRFCQRSAHVQGGHCCLICDVRTWHFVFSARLAGVAVKLTEYNGCVCRWI